MSIHSGLIHVAGQIGRDPATGRLVAGGFTAQLDQALDNLSTILAGAGSSLANVVRAQIELVDEADFDAMNLVYGRRFGPPRPARSSFGAPFIPAGTLVQIDAIAALAPTAAETDPETEHAAVVSRHGPAPTSTYPHAHVHGRTVWVTAQAGRDPTSGEMVAGGPSDQIDQAISNLETILHDCGSSLERVVHSQIMFLHDRDLDELDETFRRRLSARPPTSSWVGVSFLAEEPGTEPIRVQLDCVAALD